MPVSVVMPALELAQETGKLISWRKKEGERVSKGESLLEIETDKAVVEIEAPGDGILAAVSAHEGAIIPVGQTIAWLLQPGESEPSSSASGASAAAGRPAISPKARRLAKEHGIDIARLTGSGPGGEILAEDVLASRESPAGAARQASSNLQPALHSAPSSIERLSSVGSLMARRTTESWTSIPHFFMTREVEAGALLAAREKLAAEIERARGVRMTLTDMLVALVARVLAKHRRVNASWTGEGVRSNADVNIAIAVGVTDAVVTGVIGRADTLRLGAIAARRQELLDRARSGKLRPGDIAGATFTISNLGMYRVDAFTAIIVPPQAAILAVGAITDRVVAVDGKPAVRPMLTLTLSCDHRVVDGVRGGAFLDDVGGAIRDPERYLEAQT